MKKQTRKFSEKLADKKKISRKEAVQKMGYTALSAATMMILLNNPNKAQAQPGSEELPPDWEW